jgi:hypothetical protein
MESYFLDDEIINSTRFRTTGAFVNSPQPAADLPSSVAAANRVCRPRCCVCVPLSACARRNRALPRSSRRDRLAIHDHHRWTGRPARRDGGPARRALVVDGPTHQSFASLKVVVDRATRWRFAWQQSPLAAFPQKVKDGVEDGAKVGGARSPARSRRRQNWRNKSPRRVGQVGVVESSAHRSVSFDPDHRSFKTHVTLFKHPLNGFKSR